MSLHRTLLRLTLTAACVAALSGCGEDDPTQPVPTDTVGSGGGTIVLEGGRVRLEVPSGAVSGSFTPTVQEVAAANPDSGAVSAEYSFGPFDTEFFETVNLRLAVDPAALVDLADPQDLIGGVRVDGRWQGVPDSWFDETSSEVVIPIGGFADPDTAAVVDTGDAGSSARKRAGRAVLVVGGSRRGRGVNFAALRPVYVTPVGGSDVATCGTLAQPCFTMRYALAKIRYGEKVVLLGPGTFTDAQPVLELPPNARLEGRGGAVVEDVVLAVRTEPNLAAVRGLTLSSTVGQIAIAVSGGMPLFQDISSQTTTGVRISGGEVTLRGVNLRDTAAFIDVTGGDRHVFDGCSLRNGQAAIIFQQSTGGTLRSCTLRDNDIGVYLPYFGSVALTGSTIRGNEVGVMFGHDPNAVLATPTCTGSLAGNTIQGNRSAGVRLATTGNVQIGANTWNSNPPQRWNGPAPWVGAPDIVDILAPLGAAQWWEVSTGGPAPRLGAAMAWEHDLQQVVLFGGLGATGNVLDDTWVFEPSNMQWQRLNNVIPPSARTDHAMAGGFRSGRCFLFGGRDNSTPFNVYDDFYVLDPVAEEWLPLNPAPNPDGRRPGARYGANLVRIDSDQYLLYGGIGAAGGSYAEWWIYDAVADSWTDVTNHANLPPFRGYAAASPTTLGEVWTFGGNDAAGTPLQGLHRFVWGNGNTNHWDSYVGSLVGSRTYASLQPFSANLGSQELVLFGGVTGGFNGDVTDETWILFPSGTSPSWTRLSNQAPRPPARARHASVSYGTPHGTACLVFGGTAGGTNLLGDTWIYSPGGGNP